MKETTPFRPADAEARRLAAALLAEARYGALGVRDPATGDPSVTRVAIALDPDAKPMTLVSDLSPHTSALRAAPRASLLLGEPGSKGDPLTYPRITVAVEAEFVPATSEAHARLRAHWLGQRPKSKLYIDFGEFHLVRLHPVSAVLNGGFGKAFELSPEDLPGETPRRRGV